MRKHAKLDQVSTHETDATLQLGVNGPNQFFSGAGLHAIIPQSNLHSAHTRSGN